MRLYCSQLQKFTRPQTICPRRKRDDLCRGAVHQKLRDIYFKNAVQNIRVDWEKRKGFLIQGENRIMTGVIRPENESFFKRTLYTPALVENGILVNKSSLQMSGIKYNCEECDYEASTPRNLKDHKRNPVISILSLFRYCLAFSFLVSLSLFKTIRVVPLIRPLGPLLGKIFTPTHKENQLHPIFH